MIADDMDIWTVTDGGSVPATPPPSNCRFKLYYTVVEHSMTLMSLDTVVVCGAWKTTSGN